MCWCLPLCAGRKILVFGHHSGVLDALEAHFKPKLQAMRPSASLVMMKGSSSMEKRRDAEHRFQSDPNCRLAVLSVGAAGVGHSIPCPLPTSIGIATGSAVDQRRCFYDTLAGRVEALGFRLQGLG